MQHCIIRDPEEALQSCALAAPSAGVWVTRELGGAGRSRAVLEHSGPGHKRISMAGFTSWLAWRSVRPVLPCLRPPSLRCLAP